MTNFITEHVIRSGYTLVVEDMTDHDGIRLISIGDARAVIFSGPVVEYDPGQPKGNQVICRFPPSWGTGTQVEDMPCVIALLSEAYERAMALARDHQVYVGSHRWNGEINVHDTVALREVQSGAVQ